MDRASVWRQVQQQQATGGGGGAGAAGHAVVAASAGAASPACRPTGARWTPTHEQVKILKELYYSCGIRSPNPEQIQRIAARLRQFGKIEGKNVFYWFQNHKARERHKKRIGVVTTSPGDSNVGYLGVLSPGSGAAAAASSYCAGYGGGGASVQMDGSTTTTCWGDSAASMGATERSSVQLQDYMGVMRSTGAGNHGATPTPWPACFSFSADQSYQTPTREPETLPLFPTGGRHEGESGSGHQGSVNAVHGSSYLQSNNFQCWEAAAATTNSATFQQQHHHQLQDQQYSFYSSSNQQPIMMPSQDAGTSLELTLSFPYPARFM